MIDELEHWITTAVTPITGWVAILAKGVRTEAVPIPALLLQECHIKGDHLTRVVPAMFGVGGELEARDDDCWHVTTAEDWENNRQDYRETIANERQEIRVRMLKLIEAAGAEGITAEDLLYSEGSVSVGGCKSMAITVRNSLPAELHTWEPDPKAIGGKVCVYRAVPTCHATNT